MACKRALGDPEFEVGRIMDHQKDVPDMSLRIPMFPGDDRHMVSDSLPTAAALGFVPDDFAQFEEVSSKRGRSQPKGGSSSETRRSKK